MKNRRRLLLGGLVIVMVCGTATWLAIRPRDPQFRGKPESHWIQGLSYGDEAQVERWRAFGPDGVRVLVRALDGADRPADRLYRRVHRTFGRVLPDGAMRLLPGPRMDLTRRDRMNVVDLLSRLSMDAAAATPAMARALADEDPSVRQIAITFFTRGEDEHCLLYQLKSGTKRDLLSAFVRAMQDPNSGVRNNAIIALRCYPEQADVVVPVLRQALQDPEPRVRKLAAGALQRIDPTTAPAGGER